MRRAHSLLKALARASSSNAYSTLPLGENLFNAVSEEAVRGLVGGEGFSVLDGVFGLQESKMLGKEVEQLKRAGLMEPNCTHFVSSGRRTQITKEGIWEVEAHNLTPEGVALAPSLSAFAKDRTLLTLLNLFLQTGMPDKLHYQSLKIQANDGGGACFPLHFDSDEAVDSRRLTALFYLNPDWRGVPSAPAAHACGKRGDGGELVLHPSLTKKVIIEPKLDRLVLFSAHEMLHRVLPSSVGRRCFTVWMFGRHTATGAAGPWKRLGDTEAATAGGVADSAGSGASERTALERGPLGAPKYRKHLFRAVLADEWAASISDSHPASPERDWWLERHWAEVAQIEQALEKAAPGSLEMIEAVREENAQGSGVRVLRV